MNTTPVSLLDLKPEEFQQFLGSFDHVFSDCDGVVWSHNPLPRVGEFFDLMRKHGKTVHFVSNNSIRSRENYESMFKNAKIENGYDNLTMPSVAIAEYLKEAKFDKKVYSVASIETSKMLESYGYACKTGPDVPVEFYDSYDQYSEDDPEIGAVVFDCDFGLNLAKLHRAIAYLRRPEVLFLCGATDERVHFKTGSSTLGCGIFTDLVGQETNRKPVTLGKPSKMFGEFAMKRAGISCDPSRILFIGDMIEQDVGLGRACGFKILMILTNVPKETMLKQQLRPDYYADSLASIVPLL